MNLQRLKKTDEFSSVFNLRKRLYGEWLIAHIKPNTFGCYRFGLVVSKKTAKLAVKRNYMKRVLRELCRLEESAVNGYDVVLQVRKAFQHADFHRVQQEMSFLLRKMQKISPEKVSRNAKGHDENIPDLAG